MSVKDLGIYELYGIYGGLLTENQQRVLEDYFGLDLSMGEIAEMNQSSRQAVKDAIDGAEKQLVFFEKGLRLKEKFAAIRDLAESGGDAKEALTILEGR